MGTVSLFMESDVASRLATYLSEQFGLNSDVYEMLVRIAGAEEDILDVARKIERSHASRHVYRMLMVDESVKDVNEVVDHIVQRCDDAVIRVQGYPRSTEEMLVSLLENRVQLSPKQFDRVVNVVRMENRYHVGVFPAATFYRRNPINANLVSGAYHKLREALLRFGVPVSDTWQVLDVGAAPGGWSQYLSRRVKLVVAVDPGTMRVRADNIVHIRDRAERALSTLAQYAPFDMVVCDVNDDPRRVATTLVQVADLVRPGGHMIMTAKLVYRSERGVKFLIKEATRALAQAYTGLDTKWLLANSRRERCIHGVRG